MKNYGIATTALYILTVVVTFAQLPRDISEAAYLAFPFSIQVKTSPRKLGLAHLPKPRKQTLPDYPIEMRWQTVSGITTLRVNVLADGSVGSINVLRATAPEFGKVAKEAIRSWKFLPASENGRPISVEMDYTFEFRIDLPNEDKK